MVRPSKEKIPAERDYHPPDLWTEPKQARPSAPALIICHKQWKVSQKGTNDLLCYEEGRMKPSMPGSIGCWTHECTEIAVLYCKSHGAGRWWKAVCWEKENGSHAGNPLKRRPWRWLMATDLWQKGRKRPTYHLRYSNLQEYLKTLYNSTQ